MPPADRWTRLRKSLALLTTGILLMSSTDAAEHYLSPQGDDAAPGTSAAPWRTIEKANRELRPGDTATFLSGEYSGTICPANPGSEDAPVTYRSRDRYGAVLVGASGNPPLKMADRDHIVIDGFRFDPGTDGWVDVERCDGLEIRNCDMINGGTHYLVLHAVDCESLRLIDCQFRKNHFRGDMVHLDRCDHALIEGCSFSHVGHGPFVLRSSNNAVVRSNLFHNPWGRNQVIWTSGRVLFENNVVTEALDGAYSATSAAKHLTIDGIFRFNRIYGNRHLPMVSGSYVPPRRWAEDVNEPFRMEDTRIYHNVLADNLFRAWRLWGITISGNEFVNNIFSGNDPHGAGIQLSIDPETTNDNRFSHNIICGPEPGMATVRFGRKLWTTQQADEQGPAYQYWRVFENNIDVIPAFVDAENADHRLSPSSAGVDGGRPLTRTSMAGSGRQLPVVDGRWFYDGNGIPGERGDLIAVGSPQNVARVERVELNYYRPAILHLDRDLSWDADSPVSLPWTGSAPDIGAWQGGPSDAMPVYAVARPSTVPPGDAVDFEALIHNPEGVREATWEFGDGASAMGFAASHTYERIGPYPVRLRLVHADGRTVRAMLLVKVEEPRAENAPFLHVTFEDATSHEWGYWFKMYRANRNVDYAIEEGGLRGEKCAHIWAKGGRSDLSCALSPGEWDIDRYSYMRFGYRIPEGTPVGLLIRPFEGYEGKEISGVILGGTRARKSGPYDDIGAYELIDDDRWHEITVDVRKAREAFPDLTHPRTFRFYTHRNGRKGQEYWFDDFAILPEAAIQQGR